MNSKRSCGVPKRWVFNASPVILLARVSLIGTIVDLCDEVVIPGGVVDEVRRGSADDPGRLWLATDGASHIRTVAVITPAVAAWDLGVGEREVLSWAHEHPGCEVVLDDRAHAIAPCRLGSRSAARSAWWSLPSKRAGSPRWLQSSMNSLPPACGSILRFCSEHAYSLASDASTGPDDLRQ